VVASRIVSTVDKNKRVVSETTADKRPLRARLAFGFVASTVIWPADDGVRSEVGTSFDVQTANSLLVEIVDSSQLQPTRRLCWGIIVARHDDRATVLSAAHCVTRDDTLTPTEPFVRFADGTLRRATRVYAHPRFQRRNVSANFDIAMLEVHNCQRKMVDLRPSLLPVRLHIGGAVTVLANTSSVQRPIWLKAKIRELTATSLDLDEGTPHCQGSSGSPVFAVEGNEVTVVGVVSSGPRDCGRDARVALTSSAMHGFILNVYEGKPVVLAPRSCGECIEQAAEGSEPCVTAIESCRKEADCGRRIETFEGMRPESSRLLDSHSGLVSDPITNVVRCVCMVACRQECRRECSTG